MSLLPYISDLDPDVVSTYLHDNPEFLDQYVMSHVSHDLVERWLQKKNRQHNNRLKNDTHTDHGSVNGELKLDHAARPWTQQEVHL